MNMAPKLFVEESPIKLLEDPLFAPTLFPGSDRYQNKHACGFHIGREPDASKVLRVI